MEVADGQHALVAVPEKALLDLIHLEPEADSPQYLEELRLQHLEILDLDELRRLAGLSGRPKPRRAADRIARLAQLESQEYETL